MTGQTLGKFSTLEVAACHAIHLVHSIAIRSNLELKTRPKQLLVALLLDITLPGLTHYSSAFETF
jgi:hypothetical protein